MMNCAICGISTESVEDMIGQDWVSSFFDGDEEHGPICPSCSEMLISIAPDGEFELKEEYRGKIIYNDEVINYEEEHEGDIILGFILN